MIYWMAMFLISFSLFLYSHFHTDWIALGLYCAMSCWVGDKSKNSGKIDENASWLTLLSLLLAFCVTMMAFSAFIVSHLRSHFANVLKFIVNYDDTQYVMMMLLIVMDLTLIIWHLNAVEKSSRHIISRWFQWQSKAFLVLCCATRMAKPSVAWHCIFIHTHHGNIIIHGVNIS